MEPIQHILAIVVNDGNGSQCGATYVQRCEYALVKPHYAGAWLDMVITANNWNVKQGAESLDVIQKLKCAAEIAEYYLAHVKEF